MLDCSNTLLLIVDIQEKLVRAIHAREDLILKAQQLVQGAAALNVPILCTEQNPKGLGLTVPDIRAVMPEVQPISKFSFGCGGCKEFMDALQAAGRPNVMIAGIETHVCVYQTTCELLDKGYAVEVVADACSCARLRTNRSASIRCALRVLRSPAWRPRSSSFLKSPKVRYSSRSCKS